MIVFFDGRPSACCDRCHARGPGLAADELVPSRARRLAGGWSGYDVRGVPVHLCPACATGPSADRAGWSADPPLD